MTNLFECGKILLIYFLQIGTVMTKQTNMKRPLFVFCISFFAAGILTAGVSLKTRLLLIPFGVLAVLTVFLCSRVASERCLAVYTALLIVIPVWMSSAYQYFSCERALIACEKFDGVTDTVTVTVEEVRYSSSYFGYYTARVTGGDTVPDMTVSLGFPDGSCDTGDVLFGEVTFRTLEKGKSFDETANFIPNGILMCAEAETLTYVAGESPSSFTEHFKALNRRLTSRISAYSDGGELACAVLLGRRDLLPDSIKRDFGRIGISHLLAVSGIHLSVAVAGLDFLCDKLRVRTKAKTLLLCAAVLFFMALVGFSKSVTRAGAMHLIRFIGQLLGRRSDSLTNLGIAAVLIIFADPFSVYDTGFVLSVLACYACIVYARNTKNRTHSAGKGKRILRGMLDTVKLTLLIMGLTLPVMLKVFGSISLIAPLCNVVFIPAVTVFLYLSLVYLFVCGIPWLNAATAPVLLFAQKLIFGSAERLAALPGIEVSLKGTAVGLSAALVFVSLLVATFIYKKRRIFSAVSVGICILTFAVCIASAYVTSAASAEADFVTLGKNEGFSIRCGNSYILIDVSDGSSGFSRELTYAAENDGACEISALVLTHLHRRHISSVAALADNILLRQAVLPEAVTDDDIEITEALCELFDRRGISYTFYSRENGTFTSGGVTFTSLGYTALSRSTHPVIGFGFTVAGREFVYLGSSYGEIGEMPDAVCEADTVFLGAHPPVRKKPVTVTTAGSAVLSSSANEKRQLTVEAENGVLTMEEDSVYSTGHFKRQER